MEQKKNNNERDFFITENERQILQQAVCMWINEGKRNVSAHERLQRIRAVEKSLIVKRKPQISIWPAATAAALVLAMLGVVAFYCYGNREQAPQVAQANQKESSTTPPSVTCAVSKANGLFRCSTSDMKTWTPLIDNATCSGGELVQTARNGGSGILHVPDQYSVKLFPGTIACLSNDLTYPRVTLWCGQMQARTEGATLELCARNEDSSIKPILSLLTNGDQITLRASKVEDAKTIMRDGFELISDVDNLKALPCEIAPESVKPSSVALKDGAIQLLNTITCQYRDKSLVDIVNNLRDTLALRINLSARAEEQLGAKLFTIELGNITGAEALSKLTEKAGLILNVIEGEIILEMSGEKSQTTLPQWVDKNF